MTDILTRLDNFFQRARTGRLLIVVGAGISLDEPACAPSPTQVMSGALRALTETDAVKHAVKVDPLIAQLVATPLPQILPESFYSSIESTVGVSLHHHIWAPLGKTGVRDGNFNINHEIIARVAATTQATIITPNYDSFIEAALESWQVPYEVIHNNQLNKLIDPAPSNSVRLIKIHGDAQRVETIVSREADLLRLFDALEPLSGTFDSALVAGYSGRDLDIFPWLASRAELKRILWIEPFLNSSHRGLRISDPTRPIFLQTFLADIAIPLQSLGIISNTPSKVPNIFHMSAASECEHISEKIMRTNLQINSSALQLFALASVVTAIGYHRSSLNLLKRIQASECDLGLRERISLLRVVNLASVDRFATAIRLSSYYARYGSTKTIRYQAFIWQVFCTQQYYLQTTDTDDSIASAGTYGNYSDRYRTVEKIICMTRQLLSTMTLMPHGVSAIVAARRTPINIRSEWYDDACSYLEHLIRSYAFTQYILPREANTAFIKNLDRWTHQVGYLIGAIHLEKYASRQYVSGELRTGGVFGRLNVLEDALSQAIILRDKATYLLRNAHTTSEKEEAKEFLMEGLFVANKTGSASLMYTFYQLKNAYGLATDKDRETLAIVASKIEIHSNHFRR